MSIIDNIKNLLPAKKLQIFEYLNTLDMKRIFNEHAGNIKKCEYYYDSINASYYEDFQITNIRTNQNIEFTFAGQPKEIGKIHLPDYTATHILENIIEHHGFSDIEGTFNAIKACLDIIMKKQEVESWVIYYKLDDLKQYQYDSGGNPLPEQREILLNSMKYLKEHNFLPEPVKLRKYLVSYYNNAGWDHPLADWETRETRQANIDNAVEKRFKAVMEFDTPENIQKNEAVGKVAKIRQEINSSGNSNNNTTEKKQIL